MIRYLPAVSLVIASTALAAPQRVLFEGAESEHKWTLRELNPELPSDWSGYDYLVLAGVSHEAKGKVGYPSQDE